MLSMRNGSVECNSNGFVFEGRARPFEWWLLCGLNRLASRIEQVQLVSEAELINFGCGHCNKPLQSPGKRAKYIECKPSGRIVGTTILNYDDKIIAPVSSLVDRDSVAGTLVIDKFGGAFIRPCQIKHNFLGGH